MQLSPETIDAALRILTWCVVAFGALWLVTGAIGFFYRRAYNLTHAESDRSKNIRPDFLKVDHAKREAAIERGKAYDEVLAQRQAAVEQTTVDTVCFWSRIAAGSSAVLSLVALIAGTLQKIDQLQQSMAKFSSWDHFSRLVGDHKTGAIVAFVVIGANVIVFVQSSKKWGRSNAPGKG